MPPSPRRLIFNVWLRVLLKRENSEAFLPGHLILSLYLPGLLLSVAQGLLLPVLPLYAQSFDAPFLWVGLILAADGLGLLVADLPAGVILRKLNRRQGMVVGILLAGAATLGMFWAGSILAAFGLRLLAGMSAALYNVARHAYIADQITVATRGRQVALLGGVSRAGRFLGPLAGGAVAAAANLRAPFLLYAAVCGLAALVVLAFYRESEDAPARPAEAGLSARSIFHTFKTQAGRLAFPGLGQLLMQMVRSGPQVIFPLYAANVLGLEVQQIGWILSAGSFIDMGMFYPTGIIMDRYGRKRAIVPSTLLMAGGLALVPFAQGFWGLVAAAALAGFGNGLGSGVMMTLGADLSPRESRAEFLGIWHLIGDSGVMLGPVVVGGVADLLALQPAAWAIAATGLLAGLVFGLLVPETLKR